MSPERGTLSPQRSILGPATSNGGVGRPWSSAHQPAPRLPFPRADSREQDVAGFVRVEQVKSIDFRSKEGQAHRKGTGAGLAGSARASRRVYLLKTVNNGKQHTGSAPSLCWRAAALKRRLGTAPRATRRRRLDGTRGSASSWGRSPRGRPPGRRVSWRQRWTGRSAPPTRSLGSGARSPPPPGRSRVRSADANGSATSSLVSANRRACERA